MIIDIRIMVLDLIKKKELFTFGNGFRRNVVIFGVDMSSSVHADNEKRYFDSW